MKPCLADERTVRRVDAGDALPTRACVEATTRLRAAGAPGGGMMRSEAPSVAVEDVCLSVEESKV